MKDIYFSEFIYKKLVLQVASSNIGVIRVKIGFHEDKDFLHGLKACFPGACIFKDHGPNKIPANVLKRYLDGENPPTDLPWDINTTPFTFNVWKIVCTIPYGETRSYKEIAKISGIPEGARAAGQALKKNPLLILIPCHRVVSVDNIGGFSSGIDFKRYLLDFEQATL